ncbi:MULTISPECIES: hypothetical protein [Actinoalloteichus]|uniref:Uncharacterized protein n=1 Tax=Actinoalloteichus fjordicus TaxID=1612552 RepID=A0AAC9PV76_9PSEU|nr:MULTISPECIES: hypothetical protein [Actinoalloteichus]APU17795.1 hypothetical protein UA74_29010 [Actinoalloteichus fjordicus]APU23874.1 hypothetical protein UA75_29545 [Actinoalloteichus sp. GBA129-24]
MADLVTVIVRFLPGVVGETWRTSHLVPVDIEVGIPETVSTYCGVRIARGTAEVLEAYAGMPCELCLLKQPRSGAGA